ncbi:nicotinamide-nucleotide amidohydrolase family protein [Chitinophaga horti]|uniref:Nicotinamide-nucleotide amidohydrolase family protein n=1 Tax=Chitinophaga horti TaxID=2920382 RepID=A0ABY6J8H2_9BACT|nr:nicotinamide-nucleotide amidohydrolase family protein [Chitinophaga horti]UYQ94607.1 nicotinamide-nucleotide amidohydrolase family protein [Chitinophaga horti]
MPYSQDIAQQLAQSSHSLAVAESVTSGHIQSLLSLEKNATQFFQGGITAYNLGQKTLHLGVEPIEANNTNCVSGKVAEQMSLGVARMFLSDYGLAITGYATPVPEQQVYNLFAYVAISFQGKIVLSEKIIPKEEEMEAVQREFASKALELLAQCLNK